MMAGPWIKLLIHRFALGTTNIPTAIALILGRAFAAGIGPWVQMPMPIARVNAAPGFARACLSLAVQTPAGACHASRRP